MNQIEQNLKTMIQSTVKNVFDHDLSLDDIVIELPKDKAHGDYATNVAMRLTKVFKKNPKEIASALVSGFDHSMADVEKAEIAGPGFINFFILKGSLAQLIGKIMDAGDDYGKTTSGNGLKVNVEYVSANPTGDLHPGHARGAAIGDSVTRIMKFAGYDVTREFYVNDAGNQINNMALSLQARYYQACGVDLPLPQDGYFGKDLIDIAATLKSEIGDIKSKEDPQDNVLFFKEYGLVAELQKLKDDLKLFRVEFDVYTSEQSIYDRGLVEKALQQLVDNGMTYVHEDAVWLKTTQFGDDKDRVLVRGNGLYTYLMPDIAYHLNKKDRGYKKLVDFLGADHHGYIMRLKAAIQALGYPAEDLDVDIIQMARMIKDGEEFKMSKRTGKAVALKDLIETAGVDAIRYFFVSRAADTHMDLDLDMATKQSNENPVYYAQYAHARLCSILRQQEKIVPATHFELINHEKEVELLKQLNEFPSVVADSANTRQPHKLCNYIQRLAQLFHSFYNDCYVLDMEKPELSSQRLALVKAVQITLHNALILIGVEPVERM